MTLVLYSTPSCSKCVFLERILQGHGLLYTKVDVSEGGDAAARALLEKLGFIAVPVMYDPVRDEYRQGVDPEWLPPAQPVEVAGN